jgi:hypothetical protein
LLRVGGGAASGVRFEVAAAFVLAHLQEREPCAIDREARDMERLAQLRGWR